LLTARHVLLDKDNAEREIDEEIQRASSWPEDMRTQLIERARQTAGNRIFSIIFRVPSFTEVLAGTLRPEAFLMNLGAGVQWLHPYTFTTPDLDLAVISLDQPGRNSPFADELEGAGHIAIPSTDVLEGPSAEGRDVFSVGFPSSTAVLGSLPQDAASANWSSNQVSLPVFSFGKVAMLHDSLPFFWVDMSLSPGNSGGPVIEDDKLVGVVSEQAIVPIRQLPGVMGPWPFGKIIKSGKVLELLGTQQQKDDSPYRSSQLPSNEDLLTSE
jgi:trypsin-like peptidase